MKNFLIFLLIIGMFVSIQLVDAVATKTNMGT